MFAFRDSLEATSTQSRVEVAFTDSTLNLQGLSTGFGDALSALELETRVGFARLNQVHGDTVHLVLEPPDFDPYVDVPTADAQVTTLAGVGLMVRVADCVPVVLADAGQGVIAVAHAGRRGVALDIVTRTVEAMRALGATEIVGWVGPHVCGRCYEVPASMRDEVAALVPATRSTTRQGTPALDLGAGVRAQLERAAVTTVQVGGCTLEEAGLHSYRRDGLGSGRFAGLVWRPQVNGAAHAKEQPA